MAHIMTIPTAALLAIVGVGAGVHLGNDTMAAINPLYFTPLQGTKSYAGLGAAPRADWAQMQASEVAAMEFGTAGLSSGCVGCRAYPEEYIPQHDGSIGGLVASAAASAEYVPAQYVIYEAEPLADDGVEQIERYVSYPITQEEEAEQAIEPALMVERAEPDPAVIGM